MDNPTIVITQTTPGTAAVTVAAKPRVDELQTSLQAALQTSAQTLNLSLLDFLR